MHNINIIHRSFSPTTLFPCLAGCLTFSLPCPAYFLCLLPVSLPCLISLPRLLPFLFLAFPACFLALPIASAFCLFPCPAYFCPLPFSLPCLLPCPTYRSTFLYECTLHGYIASTFLFVYNLHTKGRNLFLLFEIHVIIFLLTLAYSNHHVLSDTVTSVCINKTPFFI